MSLDDVQKVVGVLVTADGGCRNCVASLLEKFHDVCSVSKRELCKMAAEVSDFDATDLLSYMS